VEGENDFVPDTSVPLTVTLALAGSRFPIPWSVVSAPAETEFRRGPEGVPAGTVTWIEIVHVPGAAGLPAGMVPPLRLTAVGGVIDTVPPQLFAVTLTAVRGAGRVSVKFAPV
jgi:hypothetical protein